LQSLISNHEKVNTTSEHWLLLNFVNQIKPELVSTKFSNHLAQKAFDNYKNKYSSFSFKTRFKKYILEQYTPLSENFEFVLDKTPRYWEIIDEIAELFPNSRIIVLQRNPIDVAKSIAKTWGINSFNKLNNYKRDLLLAPRVLDQFIKTQEGNPNVYSLTYEELVADTETVTKDILNWINLDFESSILDTDKNEKIKGEFGDPYQNAEHQENLVTTHRFEDSERFKDFLEGYANYLGVAHLSKFKGYNVDVQLGEYKEFKNFLSLPNSYDDDFPGANEKKLIRENEILKLEISELKHSLSYKIGRFLLSPVRFIKRM
jgi:hypothetical protein